MPKLYSYVRFSTPEQLAGDSLRRQLELTKKYAEANGHTIDESLKMSDLGLSGYTGENLRKGALGGFIEAIGLGKVAKGSILAVESLDRLSRAEISEALELFMGILRKDIVIVTLADGKRYTKESLNNLGDLVISIVLMSRANEESMMKSKRITAAWDNKRKNIGERPLTGTCPAWLDLIGNKFVVNPKKAKVVRKIFDLAAAGHGKGHIARILNEGKVPHIGKYKVSKKWLPAYIRKILSNGTAIGQFTPKGPGRKPIAPTIENYFPAIVDRKQYFKLQGRWQKSAAKFGRNSTSNLFTGILKCGKCGSTMQFVRKRPKYPQLVCSTARHGAGCTYASINYNEFERSFLTWAHEIRFETNSGATLQKLDDDAAGIAAQLSETENKLDRLADLLAGDAKDSITLVRKVKMLEAEQKTLRKTKAELDGSIAELRSNPTPLVDLKTFLDTQKGADARTRLSAMLRRTFHRIRIFPLGRNDRGREHWDYEAELQSPGIGGRKIIPRGTLRPEPLKFAMD